MLKHTQLCSHICTWCRPSTGMCRYTHYTDVIMGAIASQITSLTVVYSTVYSDADQRKHQSSASLAFVWGIHRDRWIPRTKGQLRGKCFHLMTSSWIRVPSIQETAPQVSTPTFGWAMATQAEVFFMTRKRDRKPIMIYRALIYVNGVLLLVRTH